MKAFSVDYSELSFLVYAPTAARARKLAFDFCKEVVCSCKYTDMSAHRLQPYDGLLDSERVVEDDSELPAGRRFYDIGSVK